MRRRQLVPALPSVFGQASYPGRPSGLGQAPGNAVLAVPSASRGRAPILAGALLVAALCAEAPAADPRYLQDLDFIESTVAQQGAAVRSKKIDWAAACAKHKPAFQSCASDVEHVKNVCRLLAVLRDSHTGIVRTSVDEKQLPSKGDGLFGGGLWFAWEDGRVMLRGVMKGHPQEGALSTGSVLVEIAGEPAWLALEREERRITEYQGSSSQTSLFASLSNRLLPFGERQEIELKLLTPRLTLSTVKVPRWGPGGKAFYPNSVQLPAGVEWGEGAVSKLLSVDWCSKLGYLRITGSMDASTVKAFHKAFDELKGMEALLLDCRGMGGGGDTQAWEMAGRLFRQRTVNGPGRFLVPSGSWQFTGPVVMLQDESEVSSAETFTWALSETERVVSVGRPTGGWSIIPNVFKCPSGLVDFRLGVTDRATPLRDVHTEGIGWPPDVLIPYGPVFCALEDPERQVGMDVLRLLGAGVPRQAVVQLFRDLLGGHTAAFTKAARKVTSGSGAKVPPGGKAAGLKGWDHQRLAKWVADDLKGTLLVEMAMIDSKEIALPDARGARRRLDGLLARAREGGMAAEATKLKKLVEKCKAEAVAQDALLEVLDQRFGASPEGRKAFLKKHTKTRTAQFAEKALWK